MPHTPLPELLLRLGLAVVLGAAIGWERERKDKPAGLRTHMMVTLGSAAFALLGVELLADLSPDYARARLDPIRVLQGIIGGIGFLGAGSIIRSPGNVEGLTTAAGVWVAGSVGAACGLGMYALATAVAVLVLITLTVVGTLERRFLAPRSHREAPRGGGEAGQGAE